LDHKYLTMKECIEENGGTVVEPKEKEAEGETDGKDGENEVEEIKTTIYYVTDEQQQGQYIKMFQEEGLDAVILTHNIDSAFITHMEQKNPNVRFQRIDADLTEHFKEDVGEEDVEELKKQAEQITEIFRKAVGNDKLEVKVEKLKNDGVASMVTLSEQSRRMQEMMKMYGAGMDPSMFGTDVTLILNANHPLVQYVEEHKEGEHVEMFCEQLFDLAMLANQPLNTEQMAKFVERSNQIMMLLAK
ncbi:MAG: molecular chaperone HtpG, partial [Lachnospiraceae bacterium]